MKGRKYNSEVESSAARRENARRYYQGHRKERLNYQRKHAADYAANSKRWRNRHPEQYKKSYDEMNPKKYGLTREQYDAKLVVQNNRCRLCGVVLEDNHGPAGKALDHDHGTNVPRDFLCNCCNRGIGLLKDSPLLLEKAAAYLRFWGKE